MSDSMLTAFFIILSGGLQDAYTYCCRGKVFANAQTGNIVLLSTHLFEGDWGQALRYLVPVLAFLLGIYIAECVHRHFKRMEKVHWRQLICSQVTDNSAMIVASMQAVEAGTFGGNTVYGTLENGTLSSGKISDLVPADVQEKYNAYLQQMVDGTFMK